MEVFLSGEWGAVSANEILIYEARVVCRQLGYETSSNLLLLIMSNYYYISTTSRCDILL